MQFGMNVMLWTATPGAEHATLLAQLRGIGYDLVELPIFAPENFPSGLVRQILTDTGLDVTGCGALPPGSSLIAEGDGQAQLATDYMMRCLDACAEIGAPTFIGPVYHPVGSFTGVAPTADERNRYVERMQPIADHARQAGVKIAIEPLNRFETHFLNTLADAAAVARAINHPAVGIMSDTFHQHIEEKDTAAAMRDAQDVIIHVHASESHRGCPGTGQVHWDKWAATLHAMDYDGRVVVESFGAGLPELAAATRVWRDLTGDPLVLAQEALPFVRRTLEK